MSRYYTTCISYLQFVKTPERSGSALGREVGSTPVSCVFDHIRHPATFHIIRWKKRFPGSHSSDEAFVDREHLNKRSPHKTDTGQELCKCAEDCLCIVSQLWLGDRRRPLLPPCALYSSQRYGLASRSRPLLVRGRAEKSKSSSHISIVISGYFSVMSAGHVTDFLAGTRIAEL